MRDLGKNILGRRNSKPQDTEGLDVWRKHDPSSF